MIKKKKDFFNSAFKWTLVLLLNQIGLSKKINAKSKPKVVVLVQVLEERRVLIIFQILLI